MSLTRLETMSLTRFEIMLLTRFWTTALTNWRFASGQNPTTVICQNPAMALHLAFSYGVKNTTDPSLDNQDLVLKIKLDLPWYWSRDRFCCPSTWPLASFSIMCLIIFSASFFSRMHTTKTHSVGPSVCSPSQFTFWGFLRSFTSLLLPK